MERKDVSYEMSELRLQGNGNCQGVQPVSAADEPGERKTSSGAAPEKTAHRGGEKWLLPLVLGLLAGLVLVALLLTGVFMGKQSEPIVEVPKPSALESKPAAPEPAASQDADLIYVFYRCEQERVSAQDEIAIYYKWAALEQEQVSDYYQAVDHQVIINGTPATILKAGYDEMEWDEEGFYKQRYWMDIGQLQPGEYRVETQVTLKEKVFDGWEYFEPGQKTHVCNLIVE